MSLAFFFHFNVLYFRSNISCAVYKSHVNISNTYYMISADFLKKISNWKIRGKNHKHKVVYKKNAPKVPITEVTVTNYC